MKPNAIQQALNAVQGQKNIPAASLTSDLNAAAVLSKLINDPYAAARKRMTEQFGPDQSTIRDISGKTANKITDATNFMQLLPDLKLGYEILSSSILSPKDMMESSVTYTSECDSLPTSILANLNGIVESFFDKDYKIKKLLPDILKDVLVITGSYVVAVLPENAIDDVINSNRHYSTESFEEILKENCLGHLGLLGKPKVNTKPRRSFSFESLIKSTPMDSEDEYILFDNGVNTFVRVTDNPNILKTKQLISDYNASRRNDILNIGKALESDSYIDLYTPQNTGNYTDVVAPVYKDAMYKMRPMVIFKTQDQLSRRSAGKPLVQHLPSESVIPVFAPGSPEEHLGYFIVLDESGNPIRVADHNDYYGQLRNTANQINNDVMSSLVQRTSLNYNTTDFSSLNKNNIDILTQAYTEMIESDLIARLKNGLQGGDFQIANSDSIFRIMLARSLKQQYTQVVYMPKELVTYIAIEYNEYGIGKSLIDEMKVLLGLRVITMFANTMASIRNSIGRTNVNLKLDEEDSDPLKTIEIVMHEINRTRAGVNGTLPIGASGPAEVVEWLSNAGFQFTFEGHPGIPDMKIDFSEDNTNYTKPDTDLEENLRKHTTMGLGVPAEVIDNSFSPDFATSVVQNNIMLSKRVLKIQEAITPLISEHCRKIIANSDVLINTLKEVVNDNIDTIIKRLIKKEEYKALTEKTVITPEVKRAVASAVLNEYVNSFEIRLPRPNSVELSNQMEAFNTFTEALEKGLDAFLNSGFMTDDYAGELANSLDSIKEGLKSLYQRKWMAENNFLTELFEMVTEDENGKIELDVYSEFANHNEKLMKAFANVIKHFVPLKEAATKFMEGNDVEIDSSGSDSSDSDDSGDDSGDSGGDDEFDFDMGDEEDTGGEEDTGEEEADTEESDTGAEDTGGDTGNEDAGGETESEDGQ